MERAPKNSDWLDQIQTGRMPLDRLAQLREELRQSPKEAVRLEDELALNGLLTRLPNAPISSNFAALVLREIEHQEAQLVRSSERRHGWWTISRVFRPAIGTALAALALTGWWQHRLQERQSLAASITAVSLAAAIPGVEILQDFDAIHLLRTSSQPGDLELIAALVTP